MISSNLETYKEKSNYVLDLQKDQQEQVDEVVKNYKNLQLKLSELAKSFSQPAYIPICAGKRKPKCLVLGKLVHTNEVTFHMGDSYFAETTVPNIVKIIGNDAIFKMNQNRIKFKIRCIFFY